MVLQTIEQNHRLMTVTNFARPVMSSIGLTILTITFCRSVLSCAVCATEFWLRLRLLVAPMPTAGAAAAVVPHGHGERLPDEFLHLPAWLPGSQCLLATTHDAQRQRLAGSRPRRQLLPPPVRVDMHAWALGQKMAALALARPLAG